MCPTSYLIEVSLYISLCFHFVTVCGVDRHHERPPVSFQPLNRNAKCYTSFQGGILPETRPSYFVKIILIFGHPYFKN